MVVTILAYKSESEDVCRGCVVARYSADFKWIGSADRTLTTSFLADIILANKQLDHGESAYEITFLFNGEEFPEEPGFETEGIRQDMTAEATRTAEDKLAELKRTLEAKKKSDAEKQQRDTEERERGQLALLQAKYLKAQSAP